MGGSASADFVGRLCDVGPDGKSTNVCEGLNRVQGLGWSRVTLNMGSTCCRFHRGHVVRLHICSGAFPRWMRNLQTGDPPSFSTKTCVAEHTISDGSVLHLPVLLNPPAAVNLLEDAYKDAVG